MVIQIPASSQIHNHAGTIYSRDFESDLDITENQQRLSDLYLRKRNLFTESTIYPHLSMADLDDTLLKKRLPSFEITNQITPGLWPTKSNYSEKPPFGGKISKPDRTD